jgi:preprotein translocase subunit SecY
MINNLKKVWATEHIRKKILFTLAMVVVYKVLATIPVPGVNIALLDAFTAQLQANTQLAFFGSIMGGGLEQFSIVLMGLAPYINATIIIQLLTVIVPSLEALKKEGEQGQKKINNYTRYLTVPLALAQSYGMILLLNSIVGTGTDVSIIDTKDFLGTVLPAMLFITAGTMILLWLGDLITERGIGNGTSIIIFAWVLAGVPQHIFGYLSTQSYGLLLVLFILTVAVIYVIVKFTEGYRKVPLIYTRTGRDERSYFPIRVNQAWMVPIIFAVSLITFPSLIGQILQRRGTGVSADIGNWFVTYLSLNNPGWIYILVYGLLVLGFAFFYVSITFNTTEVAESIQKRGGYIPGVRPGKETAAYLQKVSDRLNLFGGGFLALIAIFPYFVTKLNNQFNLFNAGTSNIDFLISGAGIIIVVGVILDIIRRIDTDMKSFDYKKFH